MDWSFHPIQGAHGDAGGLDVGGIGETCGALALPAANPENILWHAQIPLAGFKCFTFQNNKHQNPKTLNPKLKP